ncbi:hypothetical protein ACIRBX_16815 [Kitasatospora sp. NPDC096147]|uniref:hypothetical protein n=1 Tax=Kitasatospora sp. NPDC096147 TaxID=3364093 RepID=UPI0037F92D85
MFGALGVRRLVMAGAALALGAATLGATAVGAEAASGCYGIGGGKYNCNVWKTAPTFWENNVRAGTLNAGTNYFYCQAMGTRMSDGPYYNKWYAKTDDDSGNKGVWVNAIYISGGGNDEPVPGLPYC